MRALSLAQASRCERAKHPGCKCRCGGAMHGARRDAAGDKPIDEPDREYYEQLPEDDPHHVRSAEEKKKRAKIKRAAAKAPVGQGSLWPALEER